MINISSVSYLLDGDALRDNATQCDVDTRREIHFCIIHDCRSTFPGTVALIRPPLALLMFLLLPLLTPHFDNVAFNQLSLGILVHFDGQSDGAGGTISSLCQLHVIHPFNFPWCTSFGGQLYWNGWDLLWAMKCGSSLIHAVESHSLVHMCVGFWTPTVSQPQDMRWQSYNGISYFKKINRT